MVLLIIFLKDRDKISNATAKIFHGFILCGSSVSFYVRLYQCGLQWWSQKKKSLHEFAECSVNTESAGVQESWSLFPHLTLKQQETQWLNRRLPF